MVDRVLANSSSPIRGFAYGIPAYGVRAQQALCSATQALYLLHRRCILLHRHSICCTGTAFLMHKHCVCYSHRASATQTLCSAAQAPHFMHSRCIWLHRHLVLQHRHCILHHRHSISAAQALYLLHKYCASAAQALYSATWALRICCTGTAFSYTSTELHRHCIPAAPALYYAAREQSGGWGLQDNVQKVPSNCSKKLVKEVLLCFTGLCVPSFRSPFTPARI